MAAKKPYFFFFNPWPHFSVCPKSLPLESHIFKDQIYTPFNQILDPIYYEYDKVCLFTTCYPRHSYEVHCSFLSFYGYFCSSHRTKNLRPRIEVPKEKRESESRPEPLSKFQKSYQENRTKLESGPRKQGRPCGSSGHSVLTLELFTTFFPEKLKTNSEFSWIARAYLSLETVKKVPSKKLVWAIGQGPNRGHQKVLNDTKLVLNKDEGSP